MEIKGRHLVSGAVVVIVVLIIGIGGYFWLKKTAPERAYKVELKRLRLVEEHQRLEIEVIKQRATLNAMKKAAEDAVPKMRLVPDEDPNQ